MGLILGGWKDHIFEIGMSHDINIAMEFRLTF